MERTSPTVPQYCFPQRVARTRGSGRHADQSRDAFGKGKGSLRFSSGRPSGLDSTVPRFLFVQQDLAVLVTHLVGIPAPKEHQEEDSDVVEEGDLSMYDAVLDGERQQSARDDKDPQKEVIPLGNTIPVVAIQRLCFGFHQLDVQGSSLLLRQRCFFVRRGECLPVLVPLQE